MAIRLENVTYKYMPQTPYERLALNAVNLEINEGEFIGIIGHTGSGKSTLVQQLNGLLKPTEGRVIVDNVPLDTGKKASKTAKQKIGMVFQYPEHQLFEETIYADIAFGPKNLRLSEEEIDFRVKKAMKFVNLDYDQFASRSPFQLSGGQMRRVAIAGVIALDPKYLILDEPSAGLDPRGRKEILAQIKALHQSTGITVVLVSHNMDEIADLATRLIVMNHGQIVLNGKPQDIFLNHRQSLLEAGVDVPAVNALMLMLKEKGLPVNTSVVDVKAATASILEGLRRKASC